MLVTHPRRRPGFRQRSRGGRYGFWRWLWLVGGRGDLLEAGPAVSTLTETSRRWQRSMLTRDTSSVARADPKAGHSRGTSS